MYKLIKIISVFAFMISLSSCSSLSSFRTENPISMSQYKAIRFDGEQTIKFKANRIEVVSKFSPSFTRPNVEHLSPISIEKTAKNWAKDLLLANNFTSKEYVKYIINDASITEELNKSTSIFRKNTVSYIAKINVTVQVVNEKNKVLAETTTDAWRRATITDGTPITDKEVLWYELIENLFNQYDVKQKQTISQYLNLYLQKSKLAKEYI